MRLKGLIVTWLFGNLAGTMVHRESRILRIQIGTTHIAMNIHTINELAGSNFNISITNVDVIRLSINVDILLMDKDVSHRSIVIICKIRLIDNTMLVVATQIKVGIQQLGIVLLIIPVGIITLLTIQNSGVPVSILD
jgi:hypothetical protein